MKPKWLTYYIALAGLGAASAVAAESPQLAACIQRDVTFNGITPLTYATVSTSATSRVDLHHAYPHTFSSPGASARSGDAHLVSGDTVAIGKNCGDWAYVQYIGEARVTTGWAAASHLTPLQKTLPFDDGPPPSGSTRFDPTVVRMRLVRGHGTPVCEAYLQRLNQTVFHEPPYCGRPENDQVPRFSKLHRATMSHADFNKMFPHIKSFELSRHSEVDGDAAAVDATKWLGTSDFNPTSWRYDPPVDIENRGVPINLIVWSEVSGYCGMRQRPDGTPTTGGVRDSQQIFVQSPTSDALDDPKTQLLFGHPTRGLAIAKRPIDKLLADNQQFQPVGRSLSVFKYKESYYFDTFFDGDGWADFDGKREKLPSLNNHLAVFLRKNNVTRQVCEYIFDDSSRMTPFK
jgi:hypothetical protein